MKVMSCSVTYLLSLSNVEQKSYRKLLRDIKQTGKSESSYNLPIYTSLFENITKDTGKSGLVTEILAITEMS